MSEQAIGIRTNWLHTHIELGDILQIDRITPEGQPTLASVIRVIDSRVVIIEGGSHGGSAVLRGGTLSQLGGEAIL